MGIFGVKKPKEALEVKTYTFSTMEAAKIGDLYEYKVKATSQREAFEKLVKHFFAISESNIGEVVSSHKEVSYPGQKVFEYSGMPRWFAKRISGHVRDDSTKEDYQDSLEKYAEANDIKLDIER